MISVRIRIDKLYLVMMVVLLITVVTGCGNGRAPLVLYTDLLSGPNSGGENNKGTYLSIFGKNFGTSGLGTTTKVFIGGAEVASYRYLGASLGRPDIQQITVQIGALGNPTAGTALPINVQVNGVNSTSITPQTFMVNPGRILFLSQNGNDSTAVAGDITHPWRYMQTPAATRTSPTGVSAVAQAGDVIVMRGGTWTDLGLIDGSNQYFLKMLGVMLGSAPTGASGTGPITITAYPGETVTIHPPLPACTGVIDGVNSKHYQDGSGNPLYAQWITISNLVIPTAGSYDGPINLNEGSNHWRVVNNNLSGPDAVINRAGGVAGDGFNEAILGNHIHDIAGVGSRGETLLNHGIYIGSGTNWELAYNLIENISGGNGIQTHGKNGSTTAGIFNVNIHHNWIDNVAKHGINIVDTSASGFTVWDNIVYNTVAGCLRFNTTNLSGAKVWNNLFYDCNTNYPGYAAIMNDLKFSSGAVDFKNNIVWPSTASATYLGGDTGFSTGATFEKNIWYGGSGTVSLDASGIYANPLLNNPGAGNLSGGTPDFHLQSRSPAINTGLTSVSSLVIDNYDLTLLPNGSGYYDIGPY